MYQLDRIRLPKQYGSVQIRWSHPVDKLFTEKHKINTIVEKKKKKHCEIRSHI